MAEHRRRIAEERSGYMELCDVLGRTQDSPVRICESSSPERLTSFSRCYGLLKVQWEHTNYRLPASLPAQPEDKGSCIIAIRTLSSRPGMSHNVFV